jgi:acylphosphatase
MADDARDAGGDIVRIEAIVRGVVQGVGFRWFARDAATALGVSGWVANEADGSVRVVAEGPGPRVDELIARLRKGPPGSAVAGIAVDRTPASGGLSGFEIRARGHRGD